MFFGGRGNDSSSDSDGDVNQFFSEMVRLGKMVGDKRRKEDVQSTGKQVIRCSNPIDWQIVTMQTAIANADTLVELSLYDIKVSSQEITLPNLKRLTIFFDYDSDGNPNMPKINFNCLTKLGTLVLSYFNESIINCLKRNGNLKVLKLGEPLRNANRRLIAEQLFSEDLPFKLKELILEENFEHENFSKFLSAQMNSLKRLKLYHANMEQVALIINNSKLLDLCLGSLDYEYNESPLARLGKLKALIKKPNIHIRKLYLDMYHNDEVIKFICLQAPNVEVIDISDLDRDWVEFAAKNLLHLRLLNTHFDERAYDDEGSDYDEDDEDEDGPNPIKYYQIIIESDQNSNINKSINFRNYRDKDLRFGNEYSLNATWKR